MSVPMNITQGCTFWAVINPFTVMRYSKISALSLGSWL